ncbi:MAG: response regulator transcription factor [Chloroflexi bacterium]|nr:response regulator transcription factor [Chloroflexota bacterium]
MRVIVVGDDPLARAGLANQLVEVTGLDIVAQIAADDSVSSAYRAYAPDAVLWDLGWSLESSDWRERMSDLVEAGALVVTLLPDNSLTIEAWSAGARGLLSRESGPARVRAALNAVNQGLVAVDPALGGALLPTHSATDAFKVEELTKREHEVLKLLAEGLSNRSIAVQLEISEHTVKYHVNSILRKLGAQSRTEAVVRATRSGLILL